MKIAIFARDIDLVWRDRLCFIIRTLVEKDVELCYYKPFYDKVKDEYRLNIPYGKRFANNSELPPDTDFFLCFGGDGTFLESLTLIKDRNIPIAGINFGRLGFLSTADLEPSFSWIDDLLSGNFKIEKRTILKIESPKLPADFFPYAINEVTVQRKDPSMLSVIVKVNGSVLPTYWSDGLVLASPTGSTAYSLSIGGPIVLPTSKILIIAPIAPHNLNVRPLVVPDDTEIEITVSSRWKEAILSLDNRSVVISSGDSFKISKAEFELNYISLPSSSFIGALKEKLRWGADKRNS
ncbi:MAG: NAD(+)/NADH kinase [Bacteroidales bacterium]